jgi:molecular chaperone GrpE (heat shock protein)
VPDEPAADADAEVPTGEPDDGMVDDAVAAAVADPDDAPATPGDRLAEDEDGDGDDQGDSLLATEGPVDDDASDPTAARIEAALASVRTDVGAVRAGVDGLQVGLDSTLADLAAAAREETVAGGFDGIRQSLEELVRLGRRSDEHVAELHAENQRLRAGELASVTLPLVRDVVRLHDEVIALTDAAAPEARADLGLVRSRLLDTLARWGLAPFAPEVGDRLDPTVHEGVGAVPSAEGEPGTVASVRRVGFRQDDGRTFRAAQVEVFRAPPPPQAPAPPPADDAPDAPDPAGAPTPAPPADAPTDTPTED